MTNGPGQRLPSFELPIIPHAGALWTRGLIVALALLLFFMLDRVAVLLMDYWMLESLGFESVFWTNFEVGAALFGIAFAAVAAAIAVPAYVNGLSREARRLALLVGAIAGLVAGHLFSGNYMTYLAAREGRDFGRDDPVFGNDVGFYVFDLPAIETAIGAALTFVVVALVASVVCRLIATRGESLPERLPAVYRPLARAATRLNIALVAAGGLLIAASTWLNRYDLLTRDNFESSIANGAEALDVTGLLSTKNAVTVETAAFTFLTVALVVKLTTLRRARREPEALDWRRKLAPAAMAAALLPGVIADVAFKSAVAVRNEVEVVANEPVIQLPFIKRHIDATRAAYGFDEVEVSAFTPNGREDPEPDIERLLSSPTIRNAPLWPGYVSHFERVIDPEYRDRIVEEGEAGKTIYSPSLDTMGQQQKLRPYYDFMDVDTTRYVDRGEKLLLASTVRELPLIEPQPWLAWWGQRFVVFTHGFGLVTAPIGETTDLGEPAYTSSGIPGRTRVPPLRLRNEAVYYGEGSGSMGYSNVSGLAEHDFPTDQGRAQVFYPEDVEAGVHVDSLLKRLVFGWKSGQLTEILFSDLISDETRVHFFRTPLERLERIAPFLYLDTDPYAVAADGGLTWMVNSMTTSDRYPYSAMVELGDKSDRRTPTPRPARWANYVADSVKATVNAYTGQIELFRISDEPVVSTWAEVYPDLFEPAEAMPEELSEQMQYPTQLMHAQFDDLFTYYHQKDPVTFFSFEDAFDDADEVVGPILGEGRSISFSMEPYYWLAETGSQLPSSEEETQFSLSMAFTPEGARNLRAIVTAYQEGEDYGKLSVLQVPKGEFHVGPEQADSAIDQDAFISQQIGLWDRLGIEVIRGHTTPLLIGRELLYVEPLFIRSKQNPVPQLKRVIVVYRGRPAMGRTLEQALRSAVSGGHRRRAAPR